MKFSLRKSLTILTFALVASMAATTARASVVIDFSSGGAFGGTVTTDGTYWYGSGIPMTTMTVTGAPLNNGAYTVTGTADNIAPNPDVLDCCASLSFDSQAQTISLVGAVPGLGLGSQTLLSGTLASLTSLGGGGSYALFATGPDTKSAALLSALGLPTNMQFAFFGFTIGVTSGAPNTYYATSTDITNVPEPGVLALLGLGLVGVSRKLARRVA